MPLATTDGAATIVLLALVAGGLSLPGVRRLAAVALALARGLFPVFALAFAAAFALALALPEVLL
eukprot:2927260-Pyramimonas_sp.AAC.1